METLPSYEAAVTGPDWIDLVAPYLSVADWRRCCLVDRRFYGRFAPRFWRDPLNTIRQLGLHPNDDLAWYRRFINRHVQSVRRKTRSFVRSLDFRSFARSASGLYSSEASERAISESFKYLPRIFPGLICLLLDGHLELDPGSMADITYIAQTSLQLLDLARCRYELTPRFFGSDFCKHVVYLDISFIPGSVRTSIYSSLKSEVLGELRVLRARGREMDNQTATLLFQAFHRQLRSLDLSYNKLEDDILDEIVDHCVSLFTFRTDAYFDKEGKLVLPKDIGSRKYGPFEFIEESRNSCRPQYLGAYLADSPLYSQRADQEDLQEWQVVRPDGLGPLWHDDADTLKELLLEEAISTTATASRTLLSQPGLGGGGLTHLYLNGNKFTASGVERLLRISRGRLEHFECDSCIFSPTNPQLVADSTRVKIFGFPGSASLFRPVISSGLRSLRVHHSLVTQVPTIVMDGLSSASATRLAEGQLFNNIRRAYPLALVPNTNPRITSLTLANIPARSTGPVIERLLQFLDLASEQQKAIKDARAMFGNRGPSVLRGLRHIRLELSPDFSAGEGDAISLSDDVNFDKLLDPAEYTFAQDTISSLFDDNDEPFGITSRSTSAASSKAQKATAGAGSPTPNSKESYTWWKSGRLKSYPYSETHSEYMTYYETNPARSWTGNVYSVPVWIGPGVIGPHAAANEYMWNVQDASLRTDVGPAMPNHAAAGVPPFSYIFHAAWDAMVVPKNISLAVVRNSAGFRDVAAAVKEYRLRTMDTRDHWDGKLELVRIAMP
ncbi:hypothetical protein AAE478_005162 [Parahypoxylon ruwenzoriense]